MKNRTFLLALVFCYLAPLTANAAVVASNTIPDGTYTVTVQKMVDAKHVDVLFVDGAVKGSESILTSSRTTVDFSKVAANDQLKLSLIGGSVAVFVDLTSH